MKFYFNLQLRRFKRISEEIGIPTIVGIPILLLAFIGSSALVFYKIEYAPYVYAGIAILMLLQFGDNRRTQHISNVFNKPITSKIRLIENGVVVLPFVIFLLFQSQYIVAVGLIPIALGLTFLNSNIQSHFIIPTPFKKFPFEFIIGFRKTFWIIGILYLIILKAIQVNNFNLALVTYGVLFLIGMTYYLKPEENYFVWIFKKSSFQFLKKKVIDANICMSIVTLPALLLLIAFYAENWLPILAVSVLGFIYLTSMIFAKYSAFPKEINLPQAILYGLSMWFPPMLLIIIPIFYKQSKRKLDPILR